MRYLNRVHKIESQLGGRIYPSVRRQILVQETSQCISIKLGIGRVYKIICRVNISLAHLCNITPTLSEVLIELHQIY